jgi:ABC-type cobalamin/Fe3+-siderophores transport system ATPase subunit
MDRVLILDVRDVTFRYPGDRRDALRNVSLGVSGGELVALLGPNGSGKTTLVRVALGLQTPIAGSALVQGRAAATWPRRDLARVVGVVPQREDNLFPQRVRETVRLGRYPRLGAFGREREEDRVAVDRALQRSDVAGLAERWLWTLSGGEYQRVRIARALAQEPQLLVLDEPTEGIQPSIIKDIGRAITYLRGQGRMAILLVEQYFDFARALADKYAVMERGEVVLAGEGSSMVESDVRRYLTV